MFDVALSDPRFGKAQRCPCQRKGDAERRTAWLRQIDGLTPLERELRFERLVVNTENQAAVEAVREATAARRGMVTLSGPPGTGKSTLLACAVNEVREAGTPAVYSTVTDLLDYLRRAFNPHDEEEPDFDNRWSLLVSAEVLALDELDEFSATPWAMERFLRLIDERWRAIDRRLTLLATNAWLHALPAKISSRLSDGRAVVVTMGGRDLRPLQEWEDELR